MVQNTSKKYTNHPKYGLWKKKSQWKKQLELIAMAMTVGSGNIDVQPKTFLLSTWASTKASLRWETASLKCKHPLWACGPSMMGGWNQINQIKKKRRTILLISTSHFNFSRATLYIEALYHNRIPLCIDITSLWYTNRILNIFKAWHQIWFLIVNHPTNDDWGPDDLIRDSWGWCPVLAAEPWVPK